MSNDINHTFHFACAPDVIVSALTDGKHIQNWWTKDAAVELGKGIFAWKEHGWRVELMIEKTSTLRVTWKCEKSNMQDTNAWEKSLMTFDLNPAGKGSKMNFRHSGYKSSPCFEVCTEGWKFVLGKSLKSYLETGKGMPYGVN